MIKHPAEIICYACSLMTYWAAYIPKGCRSLRGGAQKMMQVAQTIVASQLNVGVRRIMGVPDEDDEEH